jgi:hypothetical protein
MIDDPDSRGDVSGFLLITATIHSSILCVYKFGRFCRKTCHCACPINLKFPRYGSFDDHSESRNRVDPEVRAKQNVFDSIFASSEIENSNNNDSNNF